jgi:outer membrane protein
MRFRAGAALVLTAGLFSVRTASAQSARILTLGDAEQIALKNHPRISASKLNAQAANSVVPQVRSAFHPLLTANVTTAGADSDTAIAAGTLQTSGLASRAATGIGVTQLITDFGRTASLTDSARLRAAAQDRAVEATRADVNLHVQRSYYAILAADAVLKVAQARVNMQELTVRQVRALADSSLKSTLDVSFAEVALSEAQLALYQAENASKASRALLSAAMGQENDEAFGVADVLLPGKVTDDAPTLVAEALKNRPDLSVAKLTESAARQFSDAERRLRYPAISVVGVVGAVPIRQKNLENQYSAAGLNISIPFLNGGLFAARRAEAEFRARAAGKDAEALSIQIAASVKVAWLEAENAWRRLDVTAKLVDQATTALRLANARYEIGLSGIVELTQAQLSQTSAQIAAANAKYEYLTRVANLNYAIGAFR